MIGEDVLESLARVQAVRAILGAAVAVLLAAMVFASGGLLAGGFAVVLVAVEGVLAYAAGRAGAMLQGAQKSAGDGDELMALRVELAEQVAANDVLRARAARARGIDPNQGTQDERHAWRRSLPDEVDQDAG